jgi:hypothetical protein
MNCFWMGLSWYNKCEYYPLGSFLIYLQQHLIFYVFLKKVALVDKNPFEHV